MNAIPAFLSEKFETLSAIYTEFDKKTTGYRETASCRPGCAFCCRGTGSIDITTLEGLAILAHLGRLPKAGRQRLLNAVGRDRRRRENDRHGACPFLQKNSRCSIYAWRPFACRRLYSLKTCSDNQAPLLHRRVMEVATDTLSQLQQLDDTGYTGHLSFILFMLENDAFLDTYFAGGFEPERVVDYGKSHRIVINRSAT